MSQLEDKYRTQGEKDRAINQQIDLIHKATGGLFTPSGLRWGGLGWGFDHNAGGYALERQMGAVLVGGRWKTFEQFFTFLTTYRAGILMGRDARAKELADREWRPEPGDHDAAMRMRDMLDSTKRTAERMGSSAS